MITSIVLAFIIILTAYSFATRNFDFWKKRQLFYIKPTPFLGNIGPLVRLNKPIGEFLADLYRKYPNEPYVGIFFADKPCLVVNDKNIVENILNKDQKHFGGRIFAPDEAVEPLGAKSLFALTGHNWKVARSKLSPGFTSAKLKTMFDSMMIVADNLERKINSANDFNAADLSERFTVDIITTAIFGYDGKAIDDPDHDQMRQIALEMFSGSTMQAMKINFMFLTPKLMAALRVSAFPQNSYDYMRSIVKDIVEERTENNIRRNDFMDLLLEQRKSGGWQMKDGVRFELEGDNLASQIFMFMTAALETSSSGVTFSLYEVALNQNIQDKVRKEIHEVISAHGGKLTFDCLKDLKYMDLVINETLRKYSPAPFLDKVCTEDYALPGTKIIIPKGTYIMLPLLGLHNDERFWPDPEMFDPERFRNSDELKGKPFYPFSSGIRICLGLKLAIIQIKLGLIGALRHHQLTAINKKIIADPRRFTTRPLQDIKIYATALKS